MEIRNVDGGPHYYNKFANALPSDPNYFPVGVWFESVISQADINLDKDVGLNLYVVLTANSNLTLIQRAGMRAILQQSEWRTNQTAIKSPAVVGWELFDEVDMQHGPGKGYATLGSILEQLPKDGRMRYNNYGKGVMFWETKEQAKRFVNDFQDVVSNDVYWFTDPNVSGFSEGGRLLNNGAPLSADIARRAANYGYTVDRMRELNASGGAIRPVWAFVEVGWPSDATAARGARAISPAEIQAAVWHSIIAGARGIIYFNHSFGGPHPSQHCLRDPAYALVRNSVKQTNRLIARLAPVLNAPFDDAFVKPSGSIRVMAKYHDDVHYVFAANTQNAATSGIFMLTSVGSGTAEVVGEDRTIPISEGTFSDDFADGNAVHIYKIINR